MTSPDCPVEIKDGLTARLQETEAYDYVVASIIGAGCLFYLAGTCILLKNRNWPPIKIKGVFLTALSSIGGFVWVTSTIVVLHHFPRPQHSPVAHCSLWTFWLWACFGFALWVNCLTVRMFQLYLVIQRKMYLSKPDPFRRTFVPLVVLLLAAIGISIAATFAQAIKYCEHVKDCVFVKNSYAIAIIALIPVYFLIFLWFAFQLRNIMSQWNEFRHIRIGAIMSVFLFLLSLVTVQSKVHYRVAGRCFLSSSVACAVFYYFWARNWEVIYNVLFNKEKYLLQFNEELNDFSGRSRTPQFEANPMERLVLATKRDAEEYKTRMQLLESEVTQLNSQLQRKAGTGGTAC